MATTRDLYGFIEFSENTITLKLFDSKIHRRSDYAYPCDINDAASVQQLYDSITAVSEFKEIKAMAFGILDGIFPSFTAANNFRKKAYEFCQLHGIFYSSLTQLSARFNAAIAGTYTMVKDNQKIMVIKTTRNRMVCCGIFAREDGCYRDVSLSSIQQPQYTQEWKRKLFRDSNIQRVIIMREDYDSLEFVHDLKDFFVAENSKIYNEDLYHDACLDGVVLHVLHKMGETLNPYHVSSHHLNTIKVKLDDDLLIASTPDQILPFEGFGIVFVEPMKTIKLVSEVPYELIKEIQLSTFKCKKVKVTLKINENAFYDFKVEPIYESELDEKFSKMTIADSLYHGKARIIFDKQNYHILLTDEGKQYFVVNDYGCHTTPIYIAFTEQKPLIGFAAKEIYDTKPKFVVFDIIKLCSITDMIFVEPEWGFKLAKEEENFMVTVDTVNGERRASVKFLLALIIKHALQLVKKESGKNMKELEIGFEYFIPNEILKKNFEKAAALMKLKIVFV